MYMSEITKLADLDPQSDAIERAERIFTLRRRIAALERRIRALEVSR
jgi:polyhydroxyalkanoate synthesis regulator phasin